MTRTLGISLALAFALALIGCSGEAPASGGKAPAKQDTAAAESFAARFVATNPPGDPIPAGDVRAHGVDGADVVTTGRIDEFVDGFAVMTIVDRSVKYCYDDGFECADPKARADGTVTVEFRDENGAPLRLGLKDRADLNWLDVVTVKGKISRDSRGNATVVAEKIFVHPAS